MTTPPRLLAPQRRSRGEITVVFVVLTTALVLLAGLAYDGALLLNARRQASTLALEAARAGSQAIALEALYSEPGEVAVDPARAQAAAATHLGDHNDWSITVQGDTVVTTVWVTQPLHLLSMLGIDSRRVSGSGTARAVRGVRTGDDA
ncbi:TadE/TadG family type IV pilus assembly protein [Candidatus Poriferisocius sp.]|uniref:TadE/TadG family type IV pilus assembly protein n=1 Tax=Candidatus Poriferisocius sp. TaxID=3101276 RepID=UPI003B5B578D